MNKRVVIILVTIFLLLSIAITVYIVVTQRIELRKKAQVPPYSTTYSDRTITDNCNWSGGSNPAPIVLAKAVGTIYDPQTGVQKFIIDLERGPGAAISSPTNTPAPTEAGPTATTAPAVTATPIPTNTPTATTAPQTTPTSVLTPASPTGSEVQGVADGDIIVFLSEVGCAGPQGEPNPNENQCNSCSNEDPVFFNNAEAQYVIPAGQTTKRVEISITKPQTELTCGCSQIDVHINRVAYIGNGDQSASQQIASCSTLGSAVNSKPRQYLYAVGWGNNCTIAQGPTPTPTIPVSTSTPVPSPSPSTQPSSTPTTVPSSTPTPTTGQNPPPVCEALSVSPSSGTAPLTVEFIGTASDNTAVLKFEFTYGDGQVQTIEKDVGEQGSVEVSHTYTKVGTFTATLRVQDQHNLWSSSSNDCSKTITTSGSGATVTPTPTGTQIGGPNPTNTPTPTKVASASATPAKPDVPVAGGITPTIGVALGGLLVIVLGILLAL